jgi:hypothetical protein
VSSILWLGFVKYVFWKGQNNPLGVELAAAATERLKRNVISTER